MSLNPGALQRVMKETTTLQKSPPSGFQLINNEDNPLDTIEVCLDGPEHTPFENGQFHLKIHITSHYPTGPPSVQFVTKIFHPNIAPRTGEVCVNTLKSDWNSKNTLSDILTTVKSLLIDPNPTSSLNEEAGKLYLEDYPAYCSQARLFTEIHAKRSAVGIIAGSETASTMSKPLRESSVSNTTAFKNSQAQNTLPSGPANPQRLVFRLGLKTNEDEGGEKRLGKKRNTERAGKGAFRRL